MKQERIFGIILMIAGMGILVSALLTGDKVLDNGEALIVEAFFGTTLALYILRLQRMDTEAMNDAVERIDKATASIQEISKVTAEMIAEERGREAKRKKHCLDLMKSWLNQIRDRHDNLRAVCKRLASEEVAQASKTSYSDIIRKNREWVKVIAIPNYRSCVMQISDLLGENYLSTYGLQEIEDIFTVLLDPTIPYANKEKLVHHIDELNQKEQTFDFFLEQVEKERPDKF